MLRSDRFLMLAFAALTSVVVATTPSPATSPDGSGQPRPLAASLRQLAWLLVVVTGVAVVAGTVVTASGPHAGDADARRTGLDPATVTHVHSASVFLLVGLTLAAWFALRAAGLPAANRAVLVLLGVEAGQGVIGVVQAATGLPVVLVGLHMLGSCLVWVASIALLTRVPRHPAVPVAPAPAGPAAPVPT